jgi:hypothetical protein
MRSLFSERSSQLYVPTVLLMLLAGPQRRSGHGTVKTISVPAGNQTLIVQPVLTPKSPSFYGSTVSSQLKYLYVQYFVSGEVHVFEY